MLIAQFMFRSGRFYSLLDVATNIFCIYVENYVTLVISDLRDFCARKKKHRIICVGSLIFLRIALNKQSEDFIFK